MVPVRSKRVHASAPSRPRRGTRGLRARGHRSSEPEHRTVPPESAPSAPFDVRNAPGAEHGDRMFLIFVAATLLMVVAVVAVAAVNHWWVLIPVMLLDFTVTFAVITAIVVLLNDDGRP
jgi:hypothetical protein